MGRKWWWVPGILAVPVGVRTAISHSLGFIPPCVMLPSTGYNREIVGPCELVLLPCSSGTSPLCKIPVTQMALWTPKETVQEGSCGYARPETWGCVPPKGLS